MKRLLFLGIVLLSWMLPGCSRLAGEQCALCLRQIQPNMRYRIVLQNGETKNVCCPRCGLHFQKGRKDIRATYVTDYVSGEELPAKDAVFVENSSVMPCSESAMRRDQSGAQYELSWDRCMPSIIAFRVPSEAEDFLKHHGGVLKSYAQLMIEIEAPEPESLSQKG